jgi:VWFA-related protein
VSPTRSLVVLGFAALCGLAVTSAAQAPTFRAGVNLVRLQVLVTDGPRPIPGLTAQDFEVRDNGTPQQLEAVFAEARPLDMLLVMDRSQSLDGEPLTRLKAAAHGAVDALRPGDRCGLVTFSQSVTLDTNLTADRELLHRAISGLRSDGLTSLLDAVYSGLSAPFVADRRSLILLFSDGLDNRSWTTSREVTELAQRSETIVGAVAFSALTDPRRPTSERVEPDMPFLRSLTADTGGEVIEVQHADHFWILQRKASQQPRTGEALGVSRNARKEAVSVGARGTRQAVVPSTGFAHHR